MTVDTGEQETAEETAARAHREREALKALYTRLRIKGFRRYNVPARGDEPAYVLWVLLWKGEALVLRSSSTLSAVAYRVRIEDFNPEHPEIVPDDFEDPDPDAPHHNVEASSRYERYKAGTFTEVTTALFGWSNETGSFGGSLTK
ncbi:hypothetical protein [Saccharothrix hoggarensis]|uniref:Immunity protein Imm1 n=1 Tax=Saccharothrix hoggarensis TaxID=913853 RepID=A0ABW3QLN6_9PSEU